MMVAGFNAVNLVASNNNNRRNNNNNNNNDNNDNSVQINQVHLESSLEVHLIFIFLQAGTTGDINAVNPPIILPPVPGRRRRRKRGLRKCSPTPSRRSLFDPVGALLAWLKAHLTENFDCLRRTACQVSSRTDVADEGLFGILAAFLIAQGAATSPGRRLEAVLRAARTGWATGGECGVGRYPARGLSRRDRTLKAHFSIML